MRRRDGSVISWGDKERGGDSSSVQSELKNVKAICAARNGAFAAIVGSGTVVSWGKKGANEKEEKEREERKEERKEERERRSKKTNS